MKDERLIPVFTLLAVLAALAALATVAGVAHGQQAFAPSQQKSETERFTSHNSEIAKLQPAFITPLVGADPRLLQYARFSVAHQYTPAGTETINFGNARGGGVIVGNRFEIDFVPPPFIEHNNTAVDGFGDTSALVKVRIASGNAEHGNFDVAAMVNHTFATGSHKNGAPTDSFCPTLAAGYAFKKRYDLITSLGGVMPTGKIATQGRTIAWTAIMQAHASRHVWLELENNSTFYFASSHDGMMQNFITPAAFYVVRRAEWKPAHPFFIFDAGMQIATSGFHTCNHNLISEMRVLF